MKGFGGAGAFSDGKYNITNQFGGTLYQHIGRDTATELMEYVDKLNLMHGGEGTKLYSTTNSEIRKLCLQNGLHLLDASVRHLGTDINYVVLQNLYEKMKAHVDFYLTRPLTKWRKQKTAMQLLYVMSVTRELTASSPRDEAEVNGWRLYVQILRSPHFPTVWISVSVWSFRQRCSAV